MDDTNGSVSSGSVTLVVETQTHGEGSDLERFFSVVETARRMAADHGNTEVVVTDNGSDPAIAERLQNTFPDLRRLDVRGLGYDDMKMLAATESGSDFIVYLDGDCLPDSDDWLRQHLARLGEGVAASGGHTRYDGGFLAAVLTVMDFGFLLPPGRRPLGCYAFNNVAFRRAVMLGAPVPPGPMRCRCYAHAQLLVERDQPVEMTPEARVRHELPPFLWERYRQGYDAVAACWVNPALPEVRWLERGIWAAWLFYQRNVRLDWQRLREGWSALGLTQWQALLAAPLFPVLRLIDYVGMLRALTMHKPWARPLNAYLRRRREAR